MSERITSKGTQWVKQREHWTISNRPGAIQCYLKTVKRYIRNDRLYYTSMRRALKMVPQRTTVGKKQTTTPLRFRRYTKLPSSCWCLLAVKCISAAGNICTPNLLRSSKQGAVITAWGCRLWDMMLSCLIELLRFWPGEPEMRLCFFQRGADSKVDG